MTAFSLPLTLDEQEELDELSELELEDPDEELDVEDELDELLDRDVELDEVEQVRERLDCLVRC